MTVNGVRADVISDLNRLMAEETEAFLRYFQMRFRLRGRGRRRAEKFFENALKETLEHAEALARQIQSLGHVPTLHVDLVLSGEPISAEEALAEAIDVEQQALDAYQEFLTRVTGDPVLEDFARKQVVIEAAHVQDIREALRQDPVFALVEKPTAGS
ncbi:MAG: ferritin-like domain-containing protein [Acidobacteria bacterium]|nr:ferritin-like domain-containing protein [Acidobacteriota bacterium]